MLKSKRLILAVSCSILFNVFQSFSQQHTLSGVWELTKRVSITGEDYANGIPKHINLILKEDSVIIERISIGESGDVTAKEILKANSSPQLVITPSGKVKSAMISVSDDRIGLTERASFYLPGKEGDIILRTKEQWVVQGDGDSLTINKSAETPQTGNYSMQGQYKRVKEGEKIGIQFENGNNWDEIVAKAKHENKYIFVDCYASWCGPCKQMDIATYPSYNVGEYMNPKFISLKLQMDTTNKDDEETKQSYQIAHWFSEKYSIPGYPCFLFFSPDGKIVHQSLGFQEPDGFLSLAVSALDTSKQYHILKVKYHNGTIDMNGIKDLLVAADAFGQHELVDSLSELYYEHYILKLSEKRLFNREIIMFTKEHCLKNVIKDGSSGKIFKLFLLNTKGVDSLLNSDGVAEDLLNYIITKEEISDKLFRNNKTLRRDPDWNKIYHTIAEKYGQSYSRAIVTTKTKLNTYFDGNRYHEYVETIDKMLVEYPPTVGNSKFRIAIGEIMGDDGWGGLNSIASKIVQKWNNGWILRKALKWSDMAVQLCANDTANYLQCLDTKANILYKLGRLNDAIACEEKAATINEVLLKEINKSKDPIRSGYRDVIENMKKGQPTWLN